MDQQLQGLADIDPLLPLDTESGELIVLDAVLMEPERLTDHLSFRCVLELAERADQRLILLLAEGADACVQRGQ